MKLPPWPHYSDDEIQAASATLRSGAVNYWTGTEGRQFETEFASYHGVAHGIALANGTLALELALRALDIGQGDEVIVTPRSYFASASAIAIVGATPVFVDIDRDSQNMDPEAVAAAVTPRTRAIMVVHLAGWPADMPAICDIAAKHRIDVVEDCAQAHGAAIDGKLTGSFGRLAAFSFCQDKIMTTGGEGGMLITDDEALYAKAWSFKDHGKNLAKLGQRPAAPGFRFLHDSIGSNYRLTEFQAAIGRLQLRKLDGWVARRNANAARLIDRLADNAALRIPLPPLGISHAYYKFYAFVRPETLAPGWDRDRIIQTIAEQGAPGWSGSCPEIYREVAFETLGQSRLPVANELGQTSIMLPVHPTLGDKHMDWLAAVVEDSLAQAMGKQEAIGSTS